MSRLPENQSFGRWHGPPPGAAQDGLGQGLAYAAVVQSAPVGGYVNVTIPALHLSQSFSARLQSGAHPTGAIVLVAFDENKVPWVVTGPSPGPLRATSLPSAPVDGQEIDYLADALNGVVWRFRYRSASASPHKWGFVGGASLFSVGTEAAKFKLVSGAFAYQALAGSPGVTVPLPGDYVCTVACEYAELLSVAAQAYQLNIGVGRSPASISASAAAVGNYQFYTVPVGLMATQTNCIATDRFSLYVAGNNTMPEWQVGIGALSVQPVRVG